MVIGQGGRLASVALRLVLPDRLPWPASLRKCRSALVLPTRSHSSERRWCSLLSPCSPVSCQHCERRGLIP